VEKELTVRQLTHLHKPTQDPATGSKVEPVVDRLQVIQVKSPDFNTANFDLDLMMQEMMDYAKLLLLFMSEMFQATGLQGMDNKFANLRPSFVVFDVSASLCSLLVHATRMRENENPLNRTGCSKHGPTGDGRYNESIEPTKSTTTIVLSFQRSFDMGVSPNSCMND
jgi:hypothetical protein